MDSILDLNSKHDAVISIIELKGASNYYYFLKYSSEVINGKWLKLNIIPNATITQVSRHLKPLYTFFIFELCLGSGFSSRNISNYDFGFQFLPNLRHSKRETFDTSIIRWSSATLISHEGSGRKILHDQKKGQRWRFILSIILRKFSKRS